MCTVFPECSPTPVRSTSACRVLYIGIEFPFRADYRARLVLTQCSVQKMKLKFDRPSEPIMKISSCAPFLFPLLITRACSAEPAGIDFAKDLRPMVEAR